MYVELNGVSVTETMGAFGFTWWEKVLDYMRSALRGLPEKKFVSSFWKNKTLIINLNREYLALLASGYSKAMATGGKAPHFVWSPKTFKMARMISRKLKVPVNVVYSFFSALYVLSSRGKIPYAKYDPVGYGESEELRKKFPTEETFIDKILGVGKDVGKEAKKTIMPIVIVGGIAATAFLLSQLPRSRSY